MDNDKGLWWHKFNCYARSPLTILFEICAMVMSKSSVETVYGLIIITAEIAFLVGAKEWKKYSFYSRIVLDVTNILFYMIFLAILTINGKSGSTLNTSNSAFFGMSIVDLIYYIRIKDRYGFGNNKTSIKNQSSIESLNARLSSDTIEDAFGQQEINRKTNVGKNSLLYDSTRGTVKEKPMYFAGIRNAENYLKSLMDEEGNPLHIGKKFCYSVDEIPDVLDCYQMLDEYGKVYGNLYLSIYGTDNYQYVPEGYKHLSLENPKEKLPATELQEDVTDPETIGSKINSVPDKPIKLEAPRIRYCRKCGAELNDNTLFCRMCGAKIGE